MRLSSGTILAILILLIIPALPAFAEFPDSTDINIIRQTLAYTLGEDYGRAQQTIDQLAHKYPEHPCATFFSAAALLAEMTDREHFDNDKLFHDLIKQTISRADKLRDENRQSAWAYYFMGMANLYQALQDTRKGKKFTVLKYGTRGKNLLEKTLDLDSTLYDANFGLGSYHYWGSVKTRGFEWLPLVGDNSDRGLALLKLAVDSSLFTADPSRSALARALYNERQYDSAQALIQELIDKYPQGKSFLWVRAEGNFINEYYDRALEDYGFLKTEISDGNPPNNYNLLQIYYQRILCLYKLENYQRALIEIEQALNLPLDEDVCKRHKNTLKEIEKIKDDIEKTGQEKK